MRIIQYLQILIILSFLTVSFSSLSANKSPEIKRFIIAVGANNGGSGRPKLKYAVSDASAFIDLFTKIGGVYRKDCHPLYNPDSRIFYSTMNNVKSKIIQAKKTYRKTELIFYYSGHSDESGILLGNNKVTYKTIKSILNLIPADVKITILDSCSSGAFTRTKGGQMKPSFLFDSSYDMKGNAIMTSSSSDEVSQESEKIKGSYFTYYLISGLRGAADVTQDKKITLNEAYQFAFSQTIKSTERTMGGVQHPNYNIQMFGTGDVVMTDIRKSSTNIIFDKRIYGKILIRDRDNNLIAELEKPLGTNLYFSVENGNYKIINQRDRNTYETSVRISDKPVIVSNDKLSQIKRSKTYYRGDGGEENIDSDPPSSKTVLDQTNVRFSGYGASFNTIAKVGDNMGCYSGGKAGLLVNNAMTLGISGCGLIYPTKRDRMTDNLKEEPEKTYYNFGWGGFLMEYYINPDDFFNFSFGLTTGLGAMSLSYEYEEDEEDDDREEDNMFFVMHPEFGAYIKLTRWFRAGVTIGYLYTNGVDYYGMNDRDFNSFTASIVFQFGWF